MTTVKVSKDLCIGCGACAALVEDIFEIGEDGLAETKTDKVEKDLVDEVRDAAEGCPTSAIDVAE